MTAIIVPRIVPHCTGDGCEREAKYTCAKCGTYVCEVVGGIIGDVGMKALVRRYPSGDAVMCMYCRLIAKQHVYCVDCAGNHELMLSFRGSCRTAFRSLHESNYENDDERVVGRSHENATQLADMREDKYKKMGSLHPDGAKLIRPQAEQDKEYEAHDEIDKDTGGTVTVFDGDPDRKRRQGSGESD